MSFREKFVGYFAKKYHDEIGYDSLRHQIEDALSRLKGQLWDAMDVSDELSIDESKYSIKVGGRVLIFEGIPYKSTFEVKLIDEESAVQIIDTLRSTDKGIISELDKVTFDAFGDEQLDIYLEEAFENSISTTTK